MTYGNQVMITLDDLTQNTTVSFQQHYSVFADNRILICRNNLDKLNTTSISKPLSDFMSYHFNYIFYEILVNGKTYYIERNSREVIIYQDFPKKLTFLLLAGPVARDHVV